MTTASVSSIDTVSEESINNTGPAKYFFCGKCFKKRTTEYFLKFLFLFECAILPVNTGK